MKRPRFSLRMLIIIVAMICVYLESWKLTRREAARQYFNEFPKDEAAWRYKGDFANVSALFGSTSPLPLLIVRKEYRRETPGVFPRCYYLWLFGPTWKLPFESTWNSDTWEPPTEPTW